MDEKYLELEIKISYLEDYVKQMNDVILDHTTTIDRLVEVNNQLREKVSLLEENIKETGDNTPPPHY